MGLQWNVIMGAFILLEDILRQVVSTFACCTVHVKHTVCLFLLLPVIFGVICADEQKWMKQYNACDYAYRC